MLTGWQRGGVGGRRGHVAELEAGAQQRVHNARRTAAGGGDHHEHVV